MSGGVDAVVRFFFLVSVDVVKEEPMTVPTLFGLRVHFRSVGLSPDSQKLTTNLQIFTSLKRPASIAQRATAKIENLETQVNSLGSKGKCVCDNASETDDVTRKECNDFCASASAAVF